MKRNALVPLPTKAPATVTQAELQEAIDLQNRIEVLVASGNDWKTERASYPAS